MPLVLASGAVVGGKYRLERLIGKGGMGEVWSAENVVTRQRVAIKFLGGDAQKSDETRRRFFREARAACAVRHPNVVVIHDVIEVEDQTPAIVMELFEGESLEGKLAREGRLGVEETMSLMLPVIAAVSAAHGLGIVHRDLKPDNIFLAKAGDTHCVKVLDFGVAKVSVAGDNASTGALTSTGAMLGTPYYMSPEQAFGEKQIDHRADIWSLGIVFFRCLSGQLPTKADNFGQILKIIMTRSIPRLIDVVPEIPQPISALVERMLAYTASERPADLQQVKVAIEAALSGKPDPLAAPATTGTSLGGLTTPTLKPGPAREAPRARQSRARVAVGVALVFAAGTGLTLALGVPGGARDEAVSARPALDGAGASPADGPSADDSAAATANASASAFASVIATPVTQPPVAAASASAGTAVATKLTPPAASTPPLAPAASAAPPESSLGGIIDRPGF